MTQAKAVPFERYRELWQWQLIGDPEISVSHLKVGIAICWYVNRKTGLAWPSMPKLAEATGISERTVIRAVQWLEQRGHLGVSRGRGLVGGKRPVNLYHLIPKRHASGRTVNAQQARCHAVGDKAVSKVGDKAMSYEPLIEPQNEPLSFIEASACADAAQERKRVAEVERGARRRRTSDSLAKPLSPTAGDGGEVHPRRPTASAQPPSLESRCYALARELEGDRGAALVTLALRDGALSPDDILFELLECQKSGDDIGQYLAPKTGW
jgi:hypothetical protein